MVLNFTHSTPHYWLQYADNKLQINNLEEWQNSIFQFIKEWFSSSDFIEAKTSGSTGTPKNIRLSKKAMKASAQKTIAFFNLQPNDKALLVLSAEYIAGKMMIVRAIEGKMQLYVQAPSGTPLSENRENIDFSAVVPLQLFNEIENIEAINRIRNLIIGGGAVSQTIINAMQKISCNAYETYGMTETVSHIALKQLSPKTDEYFTPLQYIEIKQDERNCLIISAPDIECNQLSTNDIIELKNNQFKIVGRFDNIINSGGIKIVPEEIERKLDGIIQNPFVISSIKEEKLGEAIVLVLLNNHNEFKIENLIDKLSRFEKPRFITYMTEFPLTASGKIDRIRIKEQIEYQNIKPINYEL